MQNVMQMPQTYAIIYKYNRLLTSRKRGIYYEDIKNIMLYGSRLPHSLQPERLQSAKTEGSLGSGTISIPTYAVKAPTAGKLIGLISEKGERISKGQPLFAIGDAQLDKQVKDLATQVAKAEADLKRMQQGTPTAAPVADTSLAQANVAAAQQKAAKMNSLLAQGAVSRNQAQAAQDELQRAIAQLQAASSVSVSFKPASPAEIEAQQKLIVQLKAQQAAAIAQQEKMKATVPAPASLPICRLPTTLPYKRIR